MTIIPTCKNVLVQLRESLSCLTSEEFTRPVQALNGSTIGQHARHTIEFFKCLKESYKTGLVDYDSRRRDVEIESSKEVSIQELTSLLEWFGNNLVDKQMQLTVNYDLDGKSPASIQSTFYRELVYNIEHAIHHMALIKVGLNEVSPHLEVDPTYGVAVSTLRHKRTAEISQF